MTKTERLAREAWLQRERRKKNPEKFRKRARAYHKKNPEIIKNSWLKSTYGITLKHYEKMLLNQDSKCAICDIHRNDVKRAFSVDHNHLTGQIRGLLCDKCNLALGHFNEDFSTIIAAAGYLEHYKSMNRSDGDFQRPVQAEVLEKEMD